MCKHSVWSAIWWARLPLTHTVPLSTVLRQKPAQQREQKERFRGNRVFKIIDIFPFNMSLQYAKLIVFASQGHAPHIRLFNA